MTAGIAVNNPKAVVISASAIPGATARRVAMFEVESPLKVINTPHTVPNNPMNGATDAVVARNVRRLSSIVNCAAEVRCTARCTDARLLPLDRTAIAPAPRWGGGARISAPALKTGTRGVNLSDSHA